MVARASLIVVASVAEVAYAARQRPGNATLHLCLVDPICEPHTSRDDNGPEEVPLGMVATVERTWAKITKRPSGSSSRGQSLDAVGALSLRARDRNPNGRKPQGDWVNQEVT